MFLLFSYWKYWSFLFDILYYMRGSGKLMYTMLFQSIVEPTV